MCFSLSVRHSANAFAVLLLNFGNIKPAVSRVHISPRLSVHQQYTNYKCRCKSSLELAMASANQNIIPFAVDQGLSQATCASSVPQA